MYETIKLNQVIDIILTIFGTITHRKRAISLAAAIFGCIIAERISSSFIGRSLARLLDKQPKHQIKQVDRLMGNPLLQTADFFEQYAAFVIGARSKIVVSIDWTEYAPDGHHVVCINLTTRQGRATPLVWKTHESARLKGRKRCYERGLLRRLEAILPPQVKRVVVLADRGFEDKKLYQFIQKKPGWDYIIRIRNRTFVQSLCGERRHAVRWVGFNGQIVELQSALVGCGKTPIGAFVGTKKKAMFDPWLLVTSIVGHKAQVIKYYSRRFHCEEQFRDVKNARFGMGLSQTRVSTADRRDRLLLVQAIATVLLTLLGAAGEKVGYDKIIRSNTSRKRTHSLFRAGREYALWVMQTYRSALSKAFWTLFEAQPVEKRVFGYV